MRLFEPACLQPIRSPSRSPSNGKSSCVYIVPRFRRFSSIDCVGLIYSHDNHHHYDHPFTAQAARAITTPVPLFSKIHVFADPSEEKFYIATVWLYDRMRANTTAVRSRHPIYLRWAVSLVSLL